jgi:hypothetical protein
MLVSCGGRGLSQISPDRARERQKRNVPKPSPGLPDAAATDG